MIRREGALLREIRANQRKLDELDAKLKELQRRKKKLHCEWTGHLRFSFPPKSDFSLIIL